VDIVSTLNLNNESLELVSPLSPDTYLDVEEKENGLKIYLGYLFSTKYNPF